MRALILALVLAAVVGLDASRARAEASASPPMYLESVPAAKRATREQLAGIADRYFTALETEGTSEYRPAPLAADANRLENGIQTTNVPFDLFHKPAATTQQQMDEAWFKGWVVTDRRYPVLDEQHGIVLAIVLMQISPTQAVLLSELFKVSGVKIRQVRAVLVDVPRHGPTGWNSTRSGATPSQRFRLRWFSVLSGCRAAHTRSG